MIYNSSIQQLMKIIQFKNIFLLVALILPIALARVGCLNHEGQIVDWFVVYTTNANTKYAFPDYGYLYFDSTYTQNIFQHYRDYGNEDHAPIGLTLAQIRQNDLSHLAWNDQTLKGLGGDPEKDKYLAHSKFYMATTSDKSQGFAMSHSVPYYPRLDQDNFPSTFINGSQRQKAQHHFCFTIYDSQTTKNLHDLGCFMNPKIYLKKGFNICKKWRTSEVFKRHDYNVGQYTIKAVYKNGEPNITRGQNSPYSYTGEIFQQGILPMLQSSIVIQTFGSPRPYQPFCKSGQYDIQNSNIIQAGKNIQWSQWFDHSKWVYALENDYVCFGDLNRNSYAQTVRGGAFYCLQSPYLNSALTKITPYVEKCYSKH